MTRPANCEICQVFELNEPRLIKTPYWFVTLAHNQAYLGRSFISLAAMPEASPN
jgi:hypothetical protein